MIHGEILKPTEKQRLTREGDTVVHPRVSEIPH